MKTRTVKHGRLQVIISGEDVIHLNKSADTFVETIDKIVDCKGIDAVLACKRNRNSCREERYLGFPLISPYLSDYVDAADKYKKTLKQSRHGLYVNTCSNDEKKAKLLKEIFDELDLNWKIVIVS